MAVESPRYGAYDQTQSPRKLTPEEEEARRRAAADKAAGVAPISLGTPQPVAPVATVAGTSGQTAQALTQSYLNAEKPIIDEKARRSQGASAADYYGRGLAVTQGNAFENGFFKTDAQRSGIEAGRGVAPIAAAAVAPVGVIDPSKGLQGNTRTPAVQPVRTDPLLAGPAAQRASAVSIVDRYRAPGTAARTTFDSAPGTRHPLLAGADGVNVAARFADPNDPTLDPKYLASLPAVPRRRDQRALPRASFFAQR